MYGRGRSEEVVGKALKRNGRRSKVVIATKFHHRMDDDDPNAWGNHRRHIVEQCEASLRRLQTDYIDLYLVHRPSLEVPIDETLRALDDLVRAGKVRYIGTSTFAAWQVMESLWVSKELGLNRFVCEQPPYNMLDRRIERELVPMAQTYGLGLMIWSPLAGGFLTGKYERNNVTSDGGRFKKGNEWMANHFISPAFRISEMVKEIAQNKGCTPSQFALAWVMQQPGVTCPIIGPRTVAQLMENLGTLNVEVSDEDRMRIDEVSPPGRMAVPYYEADFGPHLFHW